MKKKLLGLVTLCVLVTATTGAYLLSNHSLTSNKVTATTNNWSMTITLSTLISGETNYVKTNNGNDIGFYYEKGTNYTIFKNVTPFSDLTTIDVTYTQSSSYYDAKTYDVFDNSEINRYDSYSYWGGITHTSYDAGSRSYFYFRVEVETFKTVTIKYVC